MIRWSILLLVVLLSACATHKPRPTRPPEPRMPPPVVDDTRLPQAQRYRHQKDGEPAGAGIDVSTLEEPVPKVEPRARYGNKSPYAVLGKSYRVMDKASNYHERGIASWYGNKFHGYMTSSLEPYDMYKFSAAHKTLPLPSYVRVTNLENNKSVVVRVNDRGPFHENRLIDLSYAAAVRIGIWPKGTGLVDVQVLESGQDELPQEAASSAHPAPGHARIYLQLGAFADRANAQRLLERIERERLGEVLILTARSESREVHRVRLGPLASVDAADQLVDRIKRLGLGTPRVAIDE